MSLTYTKATLHDIDAMQELVRPEVESGKILERTPDEIATSIRSYLLAKEGDRLVGFGALHIHSPVLAEIRSLIISPDYRGRGIGGTIVRALLEEAKTLRIARVFTLTYEKSFFEKLGFREIPKSELPEHKIWADCIKCKLFPVCNEIALIIDI